MGKELDESLRGLWEGRQVAIGGNEEKDVEAELHTESFRGLALMEYKRSLRKKFYAMDKLLSPR